MDITHPFSKTTNRRVGNSLIVLGLLLWLLLPYSVWKKQQFADGAVNAMAQVIQYDGAPRIEFRTREGKIVNTMLDGWRPGRLAKGDSIEIEYSLANPALVESTSCFWAGQVTMAVFALGSCVIGWMLRKGIVVAGPLKQFGVEVG